MEIKITTISFLSIPCSSSLFLSFAKIGLGLMRGFSFSHKIRVNKSSLQIHPNFTHSLTDHHQNHRIPNSMWGSHRKSLFYRVTVIARTSPAFPRAYAPSSSSSSSALSAALHYSTATWTDTETSKKQSFTVNYLINNCGFLPDSALRASKHVLFQTPEKPDSVLALFRSLGFSESQLHHVVRRFPGILLSSPTKTLLPKLQFLISKGASTSLLACIISLNPAILQRSLINHLIPTFNLLNAFIQSEEKTIVSIKRGVQLLSFYGLRRNITFLVDAGVREISMARMLRQWPLLVVFESDYLRSKAEEVMDMGIDPSKANFVPALYARMLPKSMWDKKVESYKRWGWTDDLIREAFVKHPYCMMISEQKIGACIGFFVNQLGWETLAIASYPVLLTLSLEKRVIPRAAVLQVLMFGGLVKSAKHYRAYTVSEKVFLQKYVNCFKDQAPQLLKLYQEKMNLSATLDSQ